MAKRALFRTPPRRRRPRRVRTVRRAATPSWQAPRRRGPADADVAGLQPPGRGRRRHGGLVVRGLEDENRSARSAVPEPRRPVQLPSLRPAVPALARVDGEGGRCPRAVRLGVGNEPTRTRRGLRPHRVPGPPRVRDDARIRPGRGLPGPRRQSRVPLGEQLLLARREEWQHHDEDETLARSRPARGGPDRRPIPRQREGPTASVACP